MKRVLIKQINTQAGVNIDSLLCQEWKSQQELDKALKQVEAKRKQAIKDLGL